MSPCPIPDPLCIRADLPVRMVFFSMDALVCVVLLLAAALVCTHARAII